MKGLPSVLLISLTIIACGKKTIATKDVAVNTTSETQSAETTKSNVEVAEASVLAAGKTIYETKCTRCHGMKSIASYTAARWDGILKSMAPNAKLTATETEQVTVYVRANAKN